MEKQIEVIGVDHGWSNMKTVSQVFTTGIKEITTEPAFSTNIVEWNGAYYKAGGKRLEVMDDKVGNDTFYLLTLAALGKEMHRRGMQEGNMLLAAGLPLTRFGAEKQEFIRYLSRNREIRFRFEQEEYQVHLVRVSVFPQCYEAVADRIRSLPERAVIVDIGSWTIDIMPTYQYYPNESECTTTPQGLIRCMREMNEECVRRIGQELDEDLIQEIMVGGKANLPEVYQEIVEESLRKFTEKVYHMLKEHGYNLDITPIVFVGGGATVMKRFGKPMGGNVQYFQDIKANAKGYEYLGRAYLAANRKTLEAEVR